MAAGQTTSSRCRASDPRQTTSKEQEAITDRRAGKIPHVPSPGGGKQPRARTASGRWRAKRSDAGKPRGKAKGSFLGRLFK